MIYVIAWVFLGVVGFLMAYYSDKECRNLFEMHLVKYKLAVIALHVALGAIVFVGWSIHLIRKLYDKEI